MRIKNPLSVPGNPNSVVKPEYMSHGTLECRSLKESRRFYEEFLGLQCVRHGKPAMVVRCGMKFHIVCLEVGSTLKPGKLDNHWGVEVASEEEVKRIWDAAHQLKDTYKIGQITDVLKQHGAYGFYLEDLDHNWWEIQYYDGTQHDDMFDFGDRYDNEGGPVSHP